jgi:GxxExxY protein
MIYEELSYKILGCCMNVHSTLGCGLLEKCYHNALLYELQEAGLLVGSNVSYKALYHDKIVGEYFADIVVEKKIILELKSVIKLARVHTAQLLNYLHLSGCRLGFLVNFQGIELEWKRLTIENSLRHR